MSGICRPTPAGNTLYLRISGGGNPSTHTVEMKHRNWCVNLNGRNYITVSGLNLWAGAVNLQGNGNVLQNCQATIPKPLHDHQPGLL